MKHDDDDVIGSEVVKDLFFSIVFALLFNGIECSELK